MLYTYEIVEAAIGVDPIGKNEMLHVAIKVFLDGSELDIRRFAFSLETSKEAIRAELDRVMLCLNQEAEQKAIEAEQAERQTVANETINSLLGGE